MLRRRHLSERTGQTSRLPTMQRNPHAQAFSRIASRMPARTCPRGPAPTYPEDGGHASIYLSRVISRYSSFAGQRLDRHAPAALLVCRQPAGGRSCIPVPSLGARMPIGGRTSRRLHPTGRRGRRLAAQSLTRGLASVRLLKDRSKLDLHHHRFGCGGLSEIGTEAHRAVGAMRSCRNVNPPDRANRVAEQSAP